VYHLQCFFVVRTLTSMNMQEESKHGPNQQMVDASCAERVRNVHFQLEKMKRFENLRPVIAAELESCRKATADYSAVMLKLTLYFKSDRSLQSIKKVNNGRSISYINMPFKNVALRWYKQFQHHTVPCCPIVTDEARPQHYTMEHKSGPIDKQIAQLLLSMLEIYDSANTIEMQQRCESVLSMFLSIDDPDWYQLFAPPMRYV
jgi:hypothetical protein